MITILGILIGCHETSRNTGIIGKKRMDMYHQCAIKVNELMEDVNLGIPRSDVKQAQMTHFYGSKKTPKEIFGDDTEELMAFYMAQEMVAPGACVMTKEFLNSWQPYALNHSHTLPDGYHSIVPVLQKMKVKLEIDELDHTTLTYIYEDNIGSEKGLTVAANMTHAVDGFLVRETVRRCNYDLEKLLVINSLLGHNNEEKTLGSPIYPIEQAAIDHRFISLRGVEFINEYNIKEFSLSYRNELANLIDEVLAKSSFTVLTIHKSLWM